MLTVMTQECQLLPSQLFLEHVAGLHLSPCQSNAGNCSVQSADKHPVLVCDALGD